MTVGKLLQAELGEIVARTHPVEVRMRDRNARLFVSLDQRESGARDLERMIPGKRADKGAGEERLAGPELAAKGDNRSRTRDQRDLTPELFGRFRRRQVAGERKC